MTDDINERIARLVEPEPVSSASSLNRSMLGAWVSPSEYCRWEPVAFTESLDASMAVIQRRWPYYAASVGRGEDDVHQARLSVAHQRPLVDDGIRGYSNVSASHALAIALLAALEAEGRS